MAHTLRQTSAGGDQALDRTWRATVLYVSAAGALAAAAGDVTMAVYDSTAAVNKWWNATTGLWVLARVDNVMDVDALTGLYTLAVDPELISPARLELDVLCLVNAADAVESHEVVRFRHSLRSLPVTEVSLSGAPATLSELIALLAAYFGGDAVVDDEAKQLVIYQSDGVTPCASFNLTDAAGNPSTMEPFQRRVP